MAKDCGAKQAISRDKGMTKNRGAKQAISRDEGMAKDRGAKQAKQLPKVWNTSRKYTRVAKERVT